MKRKSNVRKTIDFTALALMLTGAVTWGTIGIPQLFGYTGFNVVTKLFSNMPIVVNSVFSLVGASAVWLMSTGLFKKFMK